MLKIWGEVNLSLPFEKTNAIKRAREFLYKILWRPTNGGYAKIPLEVRREARSVLKHYIADYEIEKIAKCPRCSKILGKND